MPTPLKKTVLNATHARLGGTLVDFGGWEMPLWYPSGAVKEHLAVLTVAGLFDTSHMTVLLAEGKGLRAFLNYAITKDISNLQMERAGYGIILDADGCSIDDTIVYPLDNNRFALVVNAGMGEAVISHMKTLPGSEGITWQDLTGKLGKLDIQGPKAFAILKTCFANPDTLFEKFPYFSFKGDFNLEASAVTLKDGTPILLSRTGYTGEQGFEIFLPADKTLNFWNMLLEAGEASGLIPCGLAARDSLRAGAVLPLSHQDIGHWPFMNTPWPFALPMDESGAFTKDFMGCSALNAATADHTLVFVGFDPRKVDTASARVILDGQETGTVLTAVADMAIARVDGKVVGLASPDKPEGFNPRGLVCGFIKVNCHIQPGTTVILKDARREIKVEICTDIRPGRTARKALNSIG